MSASGFSHTSVLADEVVALLAPKVGQVHCDGTLGGGGHARLVAEHLGPQGHFIGIDRDLVALEAAREHLKGLACRVTLLHGEFGDIDNLLAEMGIEKVDSFLLDVGVSSPQLDHADRGFSFMHEGPLDMRMDRSTGPTALEYLQESSDADIERVLREYGEERYARRISRMIKDAIAAGTLETTTDLAAICVDAIPKKDQAKSRIHAATRTFQAIRIAVNQELTQLENFLAAFPHKLQAGGRCAIISFHSLEDRLVKNRFRELEWTSTLPPKYAREAGERVEPVCHIITGKALFGSDAEIARNPRARSARLRVCERTTAPVTEKITTPNLQDGGSTWKSERN